MNSKETLAKGQGESQRNHEDLGRYWLRIQLLAFHKVLSAMSSKLDFIVTL